MAMFCDLLWSRKKAFVNGALASLVGLVESFPFEVLRLVALFPKRASMRSPSTLKYYIQNFRMNHQQALRWRNQNFAYIDVRKSISDISSPEGFPLLLVLTGIPIWICGGFDDDFELTAFGGGGGGGGSEGGPCGKGGGDGANASSIDGETMGGGAGETTTVLAAVAATAFAILLFDEELLDAATGPFARNNGGGGDASGSVGYPMSLELHRNLQYIQVYG
ncbi:hypothetical protein Lal_00007733 [Lupinus albus]|nr:hypothetical protein Lal_00007733 [Lupinus albus]